MTRSRAAARAAGAKHERDVADYLRDTVDDRIDRRVKTGAKDKGDLAGIRALGGGRVVAELKNERHEVKCPDCGRKSTTLNLGVWAREAEVERGNDDAMVGVVIHKRHGVGDPAQQWVTMTVEGLAALLLGHRPE